MTLKASLSPRSPPSPAVARWFRQPKLGLFLHWGLYALPAWHEQDQWRREWRREDYARLANRFAARRFNPEHWLDVAGEMGAAYVCLTAKHADGFCLWDTACTDYKVTRTPLGRDVVGELAAACRRRNLPLFLYYSVVDEHHPAYPHAGRRWEYPAPQPGDRPSKRVYLDYLKAQVTELCTHYGPLQGFWWDANIARWHDPSINALIRKLQPGIVINDRGFDPGDFGTPERDWDASVDTALAFDRPTEACQALGSQSWGHRRGEDYYTKGHLLRSIAKILAKGGHYLLNTGPMADGRIAAYDRRLLQAIGSWYRRVREAFEGTEAVSHLVPNRDVLLTRRNARTWYVVLHKTPARHSVALKPFVTLPDRAVDLVTGISIRPRNDLLPWDHEDGVGYLRLHHLPDRVLATGAPVIKLEFARPPVLRARASSNPGIEP
jgi:alpha-L-fucosidase